MEGDVRQDKTEREREGETKEGRGPRKRERVREGCDRNRVRVRQGIRQRETDRVKVWLKIREAERKDEGETGG